MGLFTKSGSRAHKYLRRTVTILCLWIWILPGTVISSAGAETSATPPETIVSQVRIDILDAPPGPTDWARLARPLIFIKEGDPFSEEQLNQSVDALKQSNQFSEIHVDAEEDDPHLVVAFQLKPFRLVKDIEVSGEYPIFERKVLNAMTMFPGAIYVTKELTKQKTAIERLFILNGYIAPLVELSPRQDPQDGNYEIAVRIVKGPYYRLDRMEISGNRAFSDNRLKMKMSTWLWSKTPGSRGRFIEKELKDDVKDLVTFYRKKGYPECTVVSESHKTADSGQVSVTVTVDEGPRYEVEFAGNHHFWDTTLKKELVFSSEGNRNNRGLHKSLRKLKELYRQAGYLEASVEVEETTTADGPGDIRHLRFVIVEGPRSIVQTVDIAGNHAIDTAQIEKQIITREPGIFNSGVYLPKTLEEDRQAVNALYRRDGYIDTVVLAEAAPGTKPDGIAVTVSIDEKQQTLVNTITIEGLVDISEDEARKHLTLQSRQPFQQQTLQKDEKALTVLFSEKGYPFISVIGKATFSPDRTEVDIVYTVDPGPLVKLGDIQITGNFRTQEKIIRNELDIATGDRFSPKRILTAQKDLRDMGALSSVRLNAVGLKEKREEVDLFIEVEESKPYYLEFGGGYESDRGIFGEAGIGDINFMGRNLAIWLNGQASQIGYRVDTGIAQPRLFGSRYSAALQAFAERKEEFNQPFGTEQSGGSLTFKRKWFDKLTASLKFEFEQRDQFPTEVNLENTVKDDFDEFRSRTVVAATPGISYDTRDSFIRPKKGLFTAASVDFSKGIRDDFDSFLRYRVDLRVFRTPWSRVTFAALGRAGYIDPYGDELKVPDDQLFFLGGIQNVRGYDENLLAFDADGDPVGGRTAVVLSLESRIDLGRNFELTLFYDTGLVGDTYRLDADEEFRSSVGLGLRYITPIGPMGLLYGHKIDPRQGESDGRWHLSIGYTF